MAQPPREGRTPSDRRSGSDKPERKVVPFRPRRSGLADAKTYHPRGRTVRESAAGQNPPGRNPPGRNPPGRNPPGRNPPGQNPPGRNSGVPAARKPRDATGRPRRNATSQPTSAGRAKAGGRASSAAGSRGSDRVRHPGRPARPSRAGHAATPPRRRQTVLVPPPRRTRRAAIPRLGNPSARLRICLAVLLALFAAVGGRLVQIQTTEGSQYAALAADSRRESLELYATRGAILDRDGNALAHDVSGYTIAADPGYVKDTREVATAVAPLLGLTTAAVEEKLSHRTRADGGPNRYVVLKKKVSLRVGDAVNRLRATIPGLIVQDDQRREVPAGDLAANVVGYTGSDGTGLAGLEASYNTVLQGVNGEQTFDVGAGGQEIPDGYHQVTPAKAGSDLVLTLDRDLQYQANKLLTERLTATKAWSGSAIVMDVKTGEILAMASAPSYDAANPSTAVKGTTLDLATAAVVEPGSVHKALTIAAGLDTGVITPRSVLTLPETIEKGGVTYRDTHRHASSHYTLMGILAQSSNVGTIMVADKLGAARLYSYQRAFGLGSKTGIGLPGESRGIVQPPENWSGPSAGSIPIGLGVAATPLQMTSLYATLANGGMRSQPVLVKSVVSPDGTVTPTPQPEPRRVVSEEAAATVVADMTAIATEEGTAPLAAVPGYLVAGKTGTGKRAEGNRYAAGNVTSFIGIVPADSPRYVISVFLHTPEGVGGAIAGPTFSDLAGFTVRRYGLSPSGAPAPPITLYG